MFQSRNLLSQPILMELLIHSCPVMNFQVTAAACPLLLELKFQIYANVLALKIDDQ